MPLSRIAVERERLAAQFVRGSTMPLMLRCNICNNTSTPAEEASVRSNVRKFRGEQFRIWRCPTCASVHARDDVDLAHYYRDYPFHAIGVGEPDWRLQAI